MDRERKIYADFNKFLSIQSGNREPDDFNFAHYLKKFGNEERNEKWFAIPDVPELERAVKKHKEGLEEDLPLTTRCIVLPVADYRQQIGRTCGLTSFRMILGALGKPIPNYEEIMGIPFNDIDGSNESDHNRFLNSSAEFSDVKERVLSIPNFGRDLREPLRNRIFQMLGDGNYLYAKVNW